MKQVTFLKLAGTLSQRIVLTIPKGQKANVIAKAEGWAMISVLPI